MNSETVYGKLGKWVGKPLAKLPRELQPIATAYIPQWKTLTPQQRTDRAIEVDRQRALKWKIKYDRAVRAQRAAPRDPLQEARGWYDVTLEADHWAALGEIAPISAAMLLCQFNPNAETYDSAKLTTTDELKPEHLVRLTQRLADIDKADPKPRTLRDWHNTARTLGLKYHSWIDGYMEATALPSSEFDGMPEREMTAELAETVYNGKGINWRYWVHQLPALTAGEASRLLCALDPDLFQDLENRPSRNDPSRHCKDALMIERLAEREGKESATPAEWLAWADGHQITVHDGFRFEVDSLGIDVSQQIQFTDTEAGVSTTYRMTQAEHDEAQQDRRARQSKGYYTLSEVAQTLADTYSLDAAALLKRMKADYHAGNLTIRARDTDAPVLQNHTLRDFYDWMFPDDIRAMLAHWKWDREFPFTPQDTAPAQTEAPEFVEPAKTGAVMTASDAPLPLTTSDIAYCFADLHWNESKWMTNLGKKPKWLQTCVAIPGSQGVSETRWNPVLIGSELVEKGVPCRSIRARFQSKPLLAEWLDAWNYHESEYLTTD